MKIGKFNIKFGEYSFPYYYTDDLSVDLLNPIFSKQTDLLLVVCDSCVKNLFGKKLLDFLKASGVRCEFLTSDVTEKQKNIVELERLTEEALRLGTTRQSCVIAFGGGCVGNLAGLLAALLYRGIRLIHIPTTLVAMSDSVLSLKQAVNTSFGKNLLGVFYCQDMVLGNFGFLKTLPDSHIKSGICESIKNVLAIEPTHFDELAEMLDPEVTKIRKHWTDILDISVQSKCKVMGEDPFEKRTGLVLEYGHTIGHAIEFLANGKISHGEAIGIGIMCSAMISKELGFIHNNVLNDHRLLFEKIGVSVKIPHFLQVSDIVKVISSDNKRGYKQEKKGNVDLILLDNLGQPHLEDGLPLTSTPLALITEILEDMRE